jgi:hypothetical protein
LNERALRSDYEGTEGKFVALAKRISNRNLSKSRGIEFDIATVKKADLMLVIEMKKAGDRGPRYNVTIATPGNREPTHTLVPFSDFMFDDSAPAGTAQLLNPAEIKMLSVIDITAAGSGKSEPNTLWIGNLTAPAK